MLGRLCLGTMLVGSVVNKVNLSVCYVLCAITFKTSSVKTLSYETLVWLLSVVTWGDSLTMSQAEVPLERRHAIYGKWVHSFANPVVFKIIIQHLLICDLNELTSSIYCNSEHEALMKSLREFNTNPDLLEANNSKCIPTVHCRLAI